MKQVVVLLMMGIFALAGCGNGDRIAEAEAGNAGSQEVPTTPVPAGTVKEPVSTETFTVATAARASTLTAFTRARNSMTLVSEVSARVEDVPTDVGDVIGADGVFARLDDTFIKLDLAKNRADQQRLKSDVAYYGREKGRYDELVKQKTAAQSTLDSFSRDHTTALQQLKALQVEERRLMEQLARHTLKAPTGWKVTERHIEPGEWVNVGDKVAELGRYDVLLVPFALSSSEYRALETMAQGSDRQVKLRLPDLGEVVTARVERVSPGFDPETRKINVDLQIDKGDFDFRGGIRTELTLNLPDPGGSVLVPKAALIKAYEEHFLVTPDNERVRVVLLGSGANGTRRVTSPDVRAGDSFLKYPVGNGS